MERKFFLRSAIFTVMLASSLATNASQSEPKTCPNIGLLKNTVISYARELDNNMWIAFQERQKYDTEEEWGFAIGILAVENEKNAVLQAQNVLPTLRDPIGPSYEGYGVWSCVYSLDNGLYAKALTPPLDVKQFQR